MQSDPISRSLIPQSTPQEDAYTQELRLRAIEKFRSEYGSNLSPQQVMQTVVWANDLNEQQLVNYLGPAAPDKSQFAAPQAPTPAATAGMPMPSFMAPPQMPVEQAPQPQQKDHFAAFTGMFREDDPTKQAPALAQTPVATGQNGQQYTYTQMQSPIIQPNGQNFGPPEKVHDKSIHLFHGKSSAAAQVESDQAFESAAAQLAQQQLGIIAQPNQDLDAAPPQPQMAQDQSPIPQQPYLPNSVAVPKQASDPYTFRIDHSHDKKKTFHPKAREQAAQVKMPDLPATAMASPSPQVATQKLAKQPEESFGGIDTSQNGQEAMATPIIVSAKDKTIVSANGEVTLEINHKG